MFLTTVKFICEMLFENLLSLFYPALQDTFQALHKVVWQCMLCESPDPTIAQWDNVVKKAAGIVAFCRIQLFNRIYIENKYTYVIGQHCINTQSYIIKVQNLIAFSAMEPFELLSLNTKIFYTRVLKDNLTRPVYLCWYN